MSETAKGPHASAGYHLWHASLRWTAEVAKAMAPLGLTHTQFFLLGGLSWLTREKGRSPSQRELADFTRLDRATASQVVRALETQGLLARQDDPDDARAFRLRVTAAGKKKFAAAVLEVRRVDARFFASAGAELPELTARLASLGRPPK